MPPLFLFSQHYIQSISVKSLLLLLFLPSHTSHTSFVNQSWMSCLTFSRWCCFFCFFSSMKTILAHAYYSKWSIECITTRGNSKLSLTWCIRKSLFVFKKKKNSLHENVTNCILILHLLLIPLLILQTQELYQTVPQKCVWIHSKGQSKHEDQSLFLTLSSSPSFPRPASSRPIVIHQAEVSWGNV